MQYFNSCSCLLCCGAVSSEQRTCNGAAMTGQTPIPTTTNVLCPCCRASGLLQMPRQPAASAAASQTLNSKRLLQAGRPADDKSRQKQDRTQQLSRRRRSSGSSSAKAGVPKQPQQTPHPHRASQLQSARLLELLLLLGANPSLPSTLSRVSQMSSA